MRRHKILTRSLLILSIITFALAAPVAVQEIPEVLLDANVTRNASQKRWDPSEEGELPLPNVPVLGPHIRPPSSPDLTDMLSQIPEQHMYTDNPHPPPDIPGLSTGPRLAVGSMPVAGPLSPPPHPSPHPSQPEPPEDRSSVSVMEPKTLSPLKSRPFPTDIFWDKVVRESRIVGSVLAAGAFLPSPPPQPSQPGPPKDRLPVSVMDPKTLSLLNSRPFPTETFWDRVVRESRIVGSILAAGAFLPHPPLPPHPSQQPSDGRLPSPSDISANPDTSSATEPTGDQPTLPGVDVETHSLLNQAPEPISTEMWNTILKGGKFKFKRSISSSNAVNVAQKYSRFLKIPHRRPGHDAAILLGRGRLGRPRN